MILIYFLVCIVGFILIFSDDSKSSKGIAGTFMMGLSISLIGSEFDGIDTMLRYTLYFIGIAFFIWTYRRYKKRKEILLYQDITSDSITHLAYGYDIAPDRQTDTNNDTGNGHIYSVKDKDYSLERSYFMSLSSNNEQHKRNHNEIYGSDIALDTTYSEPHSNTTSHCNNNSRKSSYAKEAFNTIISDAYEKQRQVIASQYKRTFVIYIVFCVLFAYQGYNLISCIVMGLLSLLTYKLLFYYPNQMSKARYKLDGYISSYEQLLHSKDSPFNYLDEAVNFELDNQKLTAQLRESREQLMPLIKENKQLHDDLIKKTEENTTLLEQLDELEKQLIHLNSNHPSHDDDNLTSDALSLSANYDDSAPIDW